MADELINWSWDRAVYVHGAINDDLVIRLTPTILTLKEVPGPIVVGIDSPGGGVEAMSAIVDLLNAPNTNGSTTEIVTVVTNRAYSAAASLLALGDYAVAFPKAKIFYHDVRYPSVSDITSRKAMQHAWVLQRDNDALALKVAQKMAARMIWNYIALGERFERDKEKHISRFSHLESAVRKLPKNSLESSFDLVGFICSLYNKTSRKGDEVLFDAVKRLVSWMEIRRISKGGVSGLKSGKRRISDLLEGASALYTKLAKQSNRQRSMKIPESLGDRLALKENLALFLCLTVRAAASETGWDIRESTIMQIQREFSFNLEMERLTNIKSSFDLMASYTTSMFGTKVQRRIESAETEKERQEIFQELYPQAEIFWAFVVLLSRSLFEGDHEISVADAQLLGVVDEILGGGPLESLREYQVKAASQKKVTHSGSSTTQLRKS